MAKKAANEINFDDEDAVKQIFSKSINKKKSKQNFYDKLISYVTLNIKKVALTAIYLLLSGIVGNIVFIINNPLTGIIISSIILAMILIAKFKNKKNGKQ